MPSFIIVEYIWEILGRGAFLPHHPPTPHTLYPWAAPKRTILNRVNDLFRIKFLRKLRLGISHLCEHKYSHGYKDTLNPLCFCNIEAETTTHYFLRCHFYNSNWATLINDLENIPISFSTVSYTNLISLLLYSDYKFSDTKNRKILLSAIRFINDLQRFDEQLFW